MSEPGGARGGRSGPTPAPRSAHPPRQESLAFRPARGPHRACPPRGRGRAGEAAAARDTALTLLFPALPSSARLPGTGTRKGLPRLPRRCTHGSLLASRSSGGRQEARSVLRLSVFLIHDLETQLWTSSYMAVCNHHCGATCAFRIQFSFAITV